MRTTADHAVVGRAYEGCRAIGHSRATGDTPTVGETRADDGTRAVDGSDTGGDGGGPIRRASSAVGRAQSLAALVAAFALGLAVRLWLVSSRLPLWWQDSDDYRAVSRQGWWDLDLWAGARPAAVPALLKLTGGQDTGFVTAQLVLASSCWAVLAFEVTRCLATARPGLRWAAGAAVVAFSLADPVTLWERSVLSESLATSSMALVLAVTLRVVRRTSWPSMLALVGAVAAFTATRDTHAVVVLLAVAGFVALRVARHGGRVPLVQAAGLGALVAVALVGLMSSQHGDRSDFPTRNLYQARVLPYPDRVDWFAAHGMPQADLFGPGGLEPHRGEGEAPVTYVAGDDPAFATWSRWVETDGRSLYVRWLATHPGVIASEPRQDPERTFNNAGGDRSFYAALDRRVVPFAGEIFFASRPLAIVVAGGAGVWCLVDRRRLTPPASVGAACVALALPHAAISWHADAMETARHLVLPVAQLHIGVLLLVIGVVVVGGAAPDDGARRATVPDDRGQPTADGRRPTADARAGVSG